MNRLKPSALYGLWMAGVACLMIILPVVVRAAPYAAYVIDARSGEVLYQENAETRLHPASLTKMMTLYLTFQAIERGQISLDTKAIISKYAASQPPSRLGLKPGQKIAVRYLIRAAALRSANDAATALGELVGGSEPAFTERMNRTGAALGMTKSTFRNANGWTKEGHMSTAHDMTVLGRRLFTDFPQYYNIFSRRTSDAGIAEVANTNRKFLDAYKGADGIKTGFTNAAGFNLTASAERDGKRIIATVLGGQSTPDRNAKMAALLDLGFRKAPSRVPARLPDPDLIAQADPETPSANAMPRSQRSDAKNVAAAVASAAAAMQSAQALRTAQTAEVSRNAPATSGRPKGRPAPTGAAQPDAALVASIRDNISTIVEEVQSADGSRPSASLVMATAAPAAVGASVTGTPPSGRAVPGPAAAASLLSAAPDSASTPVAAASEAAATITVAHAVAPKSRPARAVTAAIAAAPPATPQAAALASAPPEGAEVVTRLSTSGGHYWGINLGRFNSRYEAEKVLLRAALSETGTLDGGLRKVVQRAGGFDATFMGLSRDTADLACRRLQARNRQCFTTGP